MGRYYIEIWEGPHRIATGKRTGYECRKEAFMEAEKRVDDALPYNTVHVVLDVGFAALSGDGGTYTHENPPEVF